MLHWMVLSSRCVWFVLDMTCFSGVQCGSHQSSSTVSCGHNSLLGNSSWNVMNVLFQSDLWSVYYWCLIVSSGLKLFNTAVGLCFRADSQCFFNSVFGGSLYSCTGWKVSWCSCTVGVYYCTCWCWSTNGGKVGGPKQQGHFSRCSSLRMTFVNVFDIVDELVFSRGQFSFTQTSFLCCSGPVMRKMSRLWDLLPVWASPGLIYSRWKLFLQTDTVVALKSWEMDFTTWQSKCSKYVVLRMENI